MKINNIRKTLRKGRQKPYYWFRTNNITSETMNYKDFTLTLYRVLVLNRVEGYASPQPAYRQILSKKIEKGTVRAHKHGNKTPFFYPSS